MTWTGSGTCCSGVWMLVILPTFSELIGTVPQPTPPALLICAG